MGEKSNEASKKKKKSQKENKPNNLDGIGRRCGYLNAKSCRCKNDMKLWKLVDKKIGFIAYLSTWDYAQILAKRLFLIEFDISQVEIEEKE
jgi:hypothetical protein